MNAHDILRLFPNASQSTLRANVSAGHPRQDTVMERDVVRAPLEPAQNKKGPAGRILVRVVSVRKRLCDEDNLCSKPIIDCLRYSGAIRDDEPEKTSIVTSQRKCLKGEQEHTVIEIYKL